MSTIYGDRSEFSNLFKTVFVDLLLSSTHKERKVDKVVVRPSLLFDDTRVFELSEYFEMFLPFPFLRY